MSLQDQDVEEGELEGEQYEGQPEDSISTEAAAQPHATGVHSFMAPISSGYSNGTSGGWTTVHGRGGRGLHPHHQRGQHTYFDDRHDWPSAVHGYSNAGWHQPQLPPSSAPFSSPGTSTYVNIYGPNAMPSIEVKTAQSIRLHDVQSLVLFSLIDHMCPRWVFVKNKPLITQVFLLLANGIDQQLWERKREVLPNLRRLGAPATVIAATTSHRPAQTAAALLSVPLSHKRKREREGKEQEEKLRRAGKPPFPPSHYVPSLKTLEDNNYPVPVLGPDGELLAPEGYVATRSLAAIAAAGDPPPPPLPERFGVPLVGLDCEMCITAEGFEVTRVTLVDETGGVLMDEFVVPYNPITDYNTQFSGITPASLANCPNRLPDIQAMILRLVAAETMLVGHALENDLRGLRMVHTNVLDTALMYPHPRGPPWKSSLKMLTMKLLKRQIQQGSHDSAQDATAALDLAVLKVTHGPAWGAPPGTANTEKIGEVLGRAERRTCMIDRAGVLNQHLAGDAAAIPAATDADVAAEGAGQAAGGSYHFLWGQLHELHGLYVERSKARRAELGLPEWGGRGGPAAVTPATAPTATATVEEAAGVLIATVPGAGRAAADTVEAAAGVAATALGAAAGQADQIAVAKATDEVPSPKDTPAPKRRKLQHIAELTPAAATGPSSPGASTHTSPASKRKRAAAALADNDDRGLLAVAQRDDTDDVDKDAVVLGTLLTDAAASPTPATAATTPTSTPATAAATADDDAELDNMLQSIDGAVGTIWAALPPHALLVVATGQGDTPAVRLVKENLDRRRAGLAQPKWTPEEDAEWIRSADEASKGLCFCAIKPSLEAEQGADRAGSAGKHKKQKGKGKAIQQAPYFTHD